MVPLRWGIAGCGQRSRDFALALSVFPNDHHELRAVVSSRGVEAARKFKESIPGNPEVYDTFMKMAGDPYLDIVYIGSVVPEHFPVASLMLRHSKHVLVEAPMCIHLLEIDALIEQAKQNRVILMEGIVPMHLPMMISLSDIMNSRTVGDIEGISISLGKNTYLTKYGFAESERAAGAGFFFAPYFTHIVVRLFGDQPYQVKAVGNLDNDGVCTSMAGIIMYNNCQFVNFACSITCDTPNEITIMGKTGYCKVRNLYDGPLSIETSNLEGGTNYMEASSLESDMYAHKSSAGLKYEIELALSRINGQNMDCIYDEYRLAVMMLQDIHAQIDGMVMPKRLVIIPDKREEK